MVAAAASGIVPNGPMAKDDKAAANVFLRELFQWSVYKKSQGRVTRQVTFAALAIIVALGGWRLSDYTLGLGDVWDVVVPTAVVLAGWWISFRLVNMPVVADFLIAVEAEMNKVTWPSRTELVRSSLVVIFTIFFLAAVLFGYDVFWKFVLMVVGVVRSSGA
jgi:preprotein translocase subunit SecE